MGKVSRSKTRIIGFDNPEMDFQLLRQMGTAVYGGASVGECLTLARETGDGGFPALARLFAEQGRRIKQDADSRAAKGHGVSARDQYFAACNAWRAAEYFTPPDEEAHVELGLKSRKCFLQAMPHVPHTCEELFIDHDGARLPGYFMSPESNRPSPGTLIAVSGYDGTTEETYFQIGRAALERGFNVCLFAGPGQMDSLRFNKNSVFEPDYERPMSALLDKLLAHPGVDAQRVGLCGISVGGYFAPRAAAHDKRIKALIANSPIVDLYAYFCAIAGFDPTQDPEGTMNFSIADMAEIPDSEFPAYLKEMSKALMLRFGQPTYYEVFRRLQDFTLQGVLGEIACPVLALGGEGEGDETLRQMEAFAAGVGAPATSRLFSVEEGADSHCQLGNLRLSAAVLLDWLEEVFRG